MQKKFRILIADDHPLYRGALASVLAELESEVDILEAADFNDTMEFIVHRETSLDLILLDLFMSGGDWPTVIEEIRGLRPHTPLVVISSSDSPRDAERAMAAGCCGFIPKALGKDEILNSLRLILSCGVNVTPRVGEAKDKSDGSGVRLGIDGVRERVSQLTPRQNDVLQELRDGKSNKLIARKLNMTEGTVKLHVAAILRQTGVANRTQAAILAHKLEEENHPNEKREG
ncbi:response regulator transcription factor [Methylonatrum kenyense]|uniref:response regulator n=1 Tax=Methylonatrum kenyense TaxID=455253 RepID=UPI0020C0B954|nr:response regulator transcription factor [Methylonatrum kenyense]MCK8516515.1 response regulator transcription factor [Methylonatrum kenyense]